jgi:hypothetical protein
VEGTGRGRGEGRGGGSGAPARQAGGARGARQAGWPQDASGRGGGEPWPGLRLRTFLAVPFSGSEPHARHSALARGKKMPPARAATEGIAGDSSASANTSE